MTTITRPIEGRRIAGVAAGIADHNGWNRSTVRLAMVASCLLPGPQILLYIAGWLLLDDEPGTAIPPAPS